MLSLVQRYCRRMTKCIPELVWVYFCVILAYSALNSAQAQAGLGTKLLQSHSGFAFPRFKVFANEPMLLLSKKLRHLRWQQRNQIRCSEAPLIFSHT